MTNFRGAGRRAVVGLTGLALALGVPVAGSAQTSTVAESCQGRAATIVDLDGGDVIGTEGPDVIVAGRDATIVAKGGDDTVCLTDGYVSGGEGHDSVTVVGTDDGESLDLRDSEDLDLVLGGGYDRLQLVSGGAGTGTVDVGPDGGLLTVIPDRSVLVDLGDGDLSMDGDSSYDLFGSPDVVASATRVRLQGDAGPNALRVIAHSCRISIEGGRGRDTLNVGANGMDAPVPRCGTRTAAEVSGQQGADTLKGYHGNDRLYGGPGHDRADGNTGRDLCRAEVKLRCER